MMVGQGMASRIPIRSGADGRRLHRRAVMQGLAAAAMSAIPARSQSPARILVIGGGFGGASCARALRAGGLDVTLVEPKTVYTACPLSNEVIAGLRDLTAQQFSYAALAGTGIRIVRDSATRLDAAARRVVTSDGSAIAYDRLVVAPGIDLRAAALPGYDATAVERMPHAWQAGAQTVMLRDQLRAMPDGGTFVISVPAAPYRCPPAPYERASLVAHYFTTRKPRSKIIILDANDSFPRQKQFEAAWAQYYRGMIAWVPLSSGGNVISVDPAGMILTTDFDSYHADVANVILPQRAGLIAQAMGVADRTGWCPVDPVTFESMLVGGIHVIGDAVTAGALPRSASAAQGEGLACALAIIALLAGQTPAALDLNGICYALVAPGDALSIAGVYRPANGGFVEAGAGAAAAGVASAEMRAAEASHAQRWFTTITGEVFG